MRGLLQFIQEGLFRRPGDQETRRPARQGTRKAHAVIEIVPIPLVESALLPSAIEGSCDLSPFVNLVFLVYLPFIAPF